MRKYGPRENNKEDNWTSEEYRTQQNRADEKKRENISKI